MKSDFISFVNGWFSYGRDWPFCYMEVPVWFLFWHILLVRTLTPLNGLVLYKGLSAVFAALLVALTLLGWWLRSGLGNWVGSFLKMDLNPNALGGSTSI